MIFRKIKLWLISGEIENRLFLVALIFAMPYFLVSLSYDLINDSKLIYFVLDSSLLGVCLLFFVLFKSPKLRPFLIMLFSILMIGGLVFYWTNSGGVIGGGAYVFPVVTVLVILINKGLFRSVFTLVLLMLTFLITSDWLEVSGENLYGSLVFDFILNLIVLSFILILFKWALDKERSVVENQNEKISDLNKELSNKTEELEAYNKEIKLLSQNLGTIVHQRTQKLEEENKKDIELTFINAHLVRAPIANMLGISEILSEGHPEFDELKEKISDLDRIVRKIGEVLTEN